MTRKSTFGFDHLFELFILRKRSTRNQSGPRKRNIPYRSHLRPRAYGIAARRRHDREGALSGMEYPAAWGKSS